MILLQSTTSNLLKDIITIFYSPLAQVYKAASIGDSLSDLQNFIDDLIRTVEAVEQGIYDFYVRRRTVLTYIYPSFYRQSEFCRPDLH